ncbi:MAG TPA: DNA gyrase C-terminal beta-propeller domain-containing protein, partial [Chloroflexota bacterium]|nr:DNA gyrase C-terminal beta-propeller domain-containing protein [Chloroflexota bacterium]
GIKLAKDDYVVSLQVVDPTGALIMVGGNGLGKKTRFDEFPRQGRGGLGVRAAIVNQKTGPLVAAQAVGEDVEEIVAISANGVVIRVPVRDIKFSHRQAQGATLMKVQPGDSVVALAPLSLSDEALIITTNGHATADEVEEALGAESDEEDGDVGGGDAGQA